jgi:hypothetical protein
LQRAVSRLGNSAISGGCLGNRPETTDHRPLPRPSIFGNSKAFAAEWFNLFALEVRSPQAGILRETRPIVRAKFADRHANSSRETAVGLTRPGENSTEMKVNSMSFARRAGTIAAGKSERHAAGFAQNRGVLHEKSCLLRGAKGVRR